jgi:ABC-type sulfate transport system substrate-binding protein
MKDRIIKLLGGYTKKEVEQIRSYEYRRGRFDKSKNKTIPQLKKLIHQKLDIIFPPTKEFDRARYRWLRQNTLTTEHISKMGHKELKLVNNKLKKILKEN